MGRFLYHEPVSQGLFNLTYSCAAGTVWEAALINTKELLELACTRMESDYVALNQKMRRPHGSKEVVACRNPCRITRFRKRCSAPPGASLPAWRLSSRRCHQAISRSRCPAS